MNGITRTLCVCAVAALGGALVSHADQITGGPDGLASYNRTIDFSEVAITPGTLVENQYVDYGAYFSGGWVWDDGTTPDLPTTGAVGFLGNSDIVNHNGLTGSMEINFTEQVTGATFAAVDWNGWFTIAAYEGGAGGSLVDSFNQFVQANPPGTTGFIGFANDPQFDTIVITPLENSALSIDSLTFLAVPEPSNLTLILAALGIVAFAIRRRAAIAKSNA